jgi:hypothetical protein
VADGVGEAGIGVSPSVDEVVLMVAAALSSGASLVVTWFNANLAQLASLSPEKTPRSGLGTESVTKARQRSICAA